VRVNPRVQRNTLLLLGAGIAGPALIIAGARYPGTWTTKGFLMLTGVGVMGTTYYYFDTDVRELLLPSPSEPALD
jgi:hypothetical protein